MPCFINKKLLLLTTLLFFGHKISSYTTVIVHNYTYTTPLSCSLVMGKLFAFLEEIKYYNENDAYFALEEFIRLRPINKATPNSPSITYALKFLHNELKRKIDRVTKQIENNDDVDHESLAIGQTALIFGTIFNILACCCVGYAYSDNFSIEKRFPTVLVFCFSAALGPLFSIQSIPYFRDARNPNRDNAYLEKYKKLLVFIKQLRTHVYQHDSTSWDILEMMCP